MPDYRRARKVYRCDLCAEAIEPGRLYYNYRCVPWDGWSDDYGTFRAHPGCQAYLRHSDYSEGTPIDASEFGMEMAWAEAARLEVLMPGIVVCLVPHLCDECPIRVALTL